MKGAPHMSKHTPGPWVVGEAAGSPVWDINNHPSSKRRAAIGRISRHDDALLVAAAPEMLEALQTVLKSLLPWIVDTDDPIVDLTIEQCRAAIAKATGGDK